LTLIVALTTPESIWLLADRRLSKGGKPVKDDARKLMILETTDGRALLGYVGLGATELGTEPVDWMNNVLRGRNLPLEQSLAVLADAANRELPQHVRLMPQPGHSIVIAALVNDDARLYTIDLAFSPNRKSYQFRYTRHINPSHIGPQTPELAYGGSGYIQLAKNKSLKRDLRRIIADIKKNRVPQLVIADRLAALNYIVSKSEPTVGERCLVAWRNTKNGGHREGGNHQFYTKSNRDYGPESLPLIGQGLDLRAIGDLLHRHLIAAVQSARGTERPPEIDVDKLRADASSLPDLPDEKLR
jgi:hypothetical protein